MTKQKRKLTPEQKAAKAKRRREYQTIFINGKQKSVKREPTVDGIPVDEFIRNNADPIWLHQNEMWELIEPFDDAEDSQSEPARDTKTATRLDDDLPF